MKFIFNLSLLIYVIGVIGHELYSYDLDYLNLTDSQSLIISLIMLLRDTGLVVAVSLAIIWSLTNYTSTDNKTKAKLYVVVSIAFCIFQVGSTGYAHYLLVSNPMTGSAVLLDDPEFLSTYEENLKHSDKTLADRITYSHAIASSIYMDTGKIINVINQDGTFIPYMPTTKDKKHNYELSKARAMLNDTTQSLKNASIMWAVILITSILIGLVMLRRRAAYNKSPKRDLANRSAS